MSEGEGGAELKQGRRAVTQGKFSDATGCSKCVSVGGEKGKQRAENGARNLPSG